MLFAIVFCSVAVFLGFSGRDDISGTSGQNTSNDIRITPGTNPDMVGAWTSGSAFPAPLVDLGHGQGYSRNDTGWIYVMGGEIGLNNVRKYNINTNTWTSVSPLPTGKDRGGSARLKDSLYMIGGANASNVYTSDFYRYDIRNDAWTSRAPLPVILGWSDGAGYQDSLVYVAGGYNGTTTVNTVYVYNCISNTWRTCSPLPAIRFGGGMALSGDTLVYCGGVDGATVQSTTYRGVISQADRSVITWTTGASMPTGMFRIDAHSWGCKGIIVTGGSSAVAFTSVSNACWSYSPGANVWTTLPNKTAAWTAGQSGSVSLNGGIWKLVCASGYGGAGTISNTEIFTDTLCPVATNTTLVLVHDSVNATSIAKRKADRDSMRVYLGGIVGGYDLVTFDTNSALPPLTQYSRIIIQETSFDAIGCRWLGLTARNNLTAWLNSGTPAARKTLIMMGGDISYNYGRTGSLGIDLNFCGQILGLTFKLDNAFPSPGNIVGERLDAGNTRTIASPSDGGYYPDGNGFSNGSYALWRYGNHTSNDTLAGIGRYTTGYEVRTLSCDPRYFTGGNLQPVLVALINGGLTGVNPVNNIFPEVYSLSQNYPNPFNPVTNIKFSIPNSGLVKLVIFDILGREVKTLLNDVKPAGNYVVDFNASELSSGAYFYRLEAGNFTETKKMLLVK